MKRLLQAAVLTLACLCGTAHAAIDLYLKVSGVKGGSISAKHPGWIELHSFSSTFAATSAASSFFWTQDLDISVPPLMVSAASARRVSTVTFEAQTRTSSPLMFFRMAFENVLFKTIALSGSEGGFAVSGNMIYDKVTMTYWPQKLDGSLDTPVRGSWNFRTGSTFRGDPDVLIGLLLAQATGPVATVPEPQTWALMALGLCAIVARRRRRA